MYDNNWNLGNWHPGGRTSGDYKFGKMSVFGWVMIAFSALMIAGLIGFRILLD